MPSAAISRESTVVASRCANVVAGGGVVRVPCRARRAWIQIGWSPGHPRTRHTMGEAACEPAEAAASDANRRTCASCSTVFSSRQQLFRHLRSEGACKVEALGANATAPDKFALVFGWSVRPDDSASARSALVAAVASRAGVDAQTLDDSVGRAFSPRREREKTIILYGISVRAEFELRAPSMRALGLMIGASRST